MRLNSKELLFCFHYARLQNIREAASRASLPVSSGERLLRSAEGKREIEKQELTEKQDLLLQKAISGLLRLSFSPVNDSALLGLLDREALQERLDTLDLFMVSELKIPKDGAVEVKFFDRLKAIDKLLELVSIAGGKTQAGEFYQALSGAAAALKESGDDNSI